MAADSFPTWCQSSAEYETYYVPQRNSSPFVQAMIIDLQIHLFRGVTLHGGSFVAPDGSLRYTADATGIMTREAGDGRGSVQHYSIGSSILRGRVVDTKGQPVEGAALLIDNVPVFTDSDGRFFCASGGRILTNYRCCRTNF